MKGYVLVELDLDEQMPMPFRAAAEAIRAAKVPGATALHVAAGDAGLRELIARLAHIPDVLAERTQP